MLRSKGVFTTYYNNNLILDTNNIIHKKFSTDLNGMKPRPSSHFYKELEVMQLLEKNFINTPKIDHYPFPRVISYDNNTISMTFCGINAIENACLYSEKLNITPVDYYKTIQCIINNLKNISKEWILGFKKLINYTSNQNVKFFDVVDEQLFESFEEIKELLSSNDYQNIRAFSVEYQADYNGKLEKAINQ